MKKLYRFILGIGILAGFLTEAGAQVSNSLYFMQGIPQSNRINPAFHPDCDLYIGIPFLAPLRTEETSSPFAWSDLIYPHPTQDSLITPLHPLGDKDAFLNKLKPTNYLLSSSGSSWLSVGFRTEIGFFSVDVTTRFDGSLYVPGDLGLLLINGTEDGKTYNLDGISTDWMGFDEVSVGWSSTIWDKLNIGVRGKVLFGVGNIATVNSNLSLTTSQDSWNILSDMHFAASLPFADVSYDDEGKISDISLKDDVENLDPWQLPKYAFNARNFGLGVDLGIEYRPADNLLLSASLLDVGYIKWKDETHEMTYKTEYDFPGFEIDPLEFSDDFTFENYLDSAFSQMGDSLSGFLEFAPGGVYSRRLNTKLFVGASYSVTPEINFGLLSRTDFLTGQIAESLTASANFSVAHWLDLSVSYSYIHSYFKNVGAGFSIHKGPINLYVVSDNAMNLVFWPQDTRAVNLWLGVNLIFGCKDIYRDRPLVY